MKKKIIMENLFKKETFINGFKATYEDLIWLFRNLELGKTILRMVKNFKTKLFIYTY